MIVDTSVVIALAFREPSAPWILDRLAAFPAEPMRISWVNLAEANIVLMKAGPRAAAELQPALERVGVEMLEPSFPVIQMVAQARLRFSLHFGDCFAYAHARLLNEPLLTLDSDFLKTDLSSVLHPDA